MHKPRSDTTYELYPSAARGKKSVLVAEPEALIRLTVMRELYAAALEPLCVATASAASQAACRGSFGAAIAECVFPETEPGSVLRAIHSCRPELPLICTTSGGFREIALSSGATVVIDKPYIYSYLTQCLFTHIPP